MSRLRARTWTRTERIAAFFRHPNVYASLERPPMCVLNAMRYRRPSREEAVKIHEQTVRAKGYATNRLAPRYYSRGKFEHGCDADVRLSISRYANRKYPLKRPRPLSIPERNVAWNDSWFMMGWVPSDSNPKIFVRRSA